MSTQGYVLGPTEGEHLIRNNGHVYLIKVDPSRGSNDMALGTQQVPIHTGILVHQHQEADEVLHCHFPRVSVMKCVEPIRRALAVVPFAH